MKREILKFAAIPFVMGLAACSDILEGESPSGGRQQEKVSLVATVEECTPLRQTRTQVGGMAENGALLIEWSPGDSIGVFGDGSTVNACFIGTNTEAAATTFFTGTTGGDTPAYAYYPYQEGVTDKTSVPVEIPAEQLYTDEGSVALYDVKAASDITLRQSGSEQGYRVQFRQMAALVRFEIDLSGVQELADDELLLDIVVRPQRQEGASPMTGRFTYDLTDLDAGLRPDGSTTDSIKLVFTYPPTAREKAVAYAVVAPGEHAGEAWECVFTTDRQVGTFVTTVLCDFEAGKYYTVPLTAPVLENNQCSYEENPEADEETANCYLLTAPGEYDFKATVIGNGMKGIIPGAGFHVETPYINPKSVKVLWSDHQTFLTDVRLVNGRVHYTVPEDVTAGNAIVAVYSEPDCQGDILWSWHIWLTIGVPEDEEYTNQAGAKFMVLDRELGAVRVGQNGCLYQWGRKDPFPGCHSGSRIYNEEYNTSTGLTVSNQYPYLLAADGATIEDAVRHPHYLIAPVTTGLYNWLGEDNFYLWGDAGRYLPDDLREAEAGAGWNQTKTIYDPSPVGYRVANIFTFSGFTNCPSGTNGDMEDAEKLDGVNYVKATVGTNNWYFKRNADDTEGVCYSAIRSRDGETGREKERAGYGGYWWAAEAYAGTDRAYACYLNTDKFEGNGYVSSYHTIETYGRGYLLCDAYAVRCVRYDNN